MTSKEIINKRYALSDSLLRKCKSQFKVYFKEIYDEITLMYSMVDKRDKELSEEANPIIKRYAENKIKEWKDKGIVIGYFKLFLSKLKRYTYANVLELLTYGIYYSKLKPIDEYSNECFKQVANNANDQAREELKIKKSKWKSLTDRNIFDMLYLANVNKTFLEYLELIFVESIRKTYTEIINEKSQNKDLDNGVLNDLLSKQLKRIVNINDSDKVVKHSGLIDDMFCNLVNQGYLFNLKENENAKVEFIADVDERTTEMCLSLNGQEFYVNKENEFFRYSDSAGGVVRVKCNGLVTGVNLPPITDHYHYCRSSIIYK